MRGRCKCLLAAFEAGLFDLQRALQNEFFIRTGRAFDALKQQVNGRTARRFSGLADDGQRWFDDVAPCGFVKADQCDVLRNTDVLRAQGLKSADGDEVVAGKNTVWLDAAVQQLRCFDSLVQYVVR